MEDIHVSFNCILMIFEMDELSSILSGIVRFSDRTYKDDCTG